MLALIGMMSSFHPDRRAAVAVQIFLSNNSPNRFRTTSHFFWAPTMIVDKLAERPLAAATPADEMGLLADRGDCVGRGGGRKPAGFEKREVVDIVADERDLLRPQPMPGQNLVKRRPLIDDALIELIDSEAPGPAFQGFRAFPGDEPDFQVRPIGRSYTPNPSLVL